MAMVDEVLRELDRKKEINQIPVVVQDPVVPKIFKEFYKVQKEPQVFKTGQPDA